MDNNSTFTGAVKQKRHQLLWMLLPFAAFLYMLNSSYQVMADGSPQFRPDTTKASNLMILNTESTYGTFASFTATDTNRLYIRINDPSTEKIYFGIGQRSTNSNWYVRIKNPNGVVIFGPQLLPTSTGTGYINNHKQAIAGPSVVNALGYNGFNTNPTSGLPGNYYIEFNQGSASTVANNTELDLGIFDVTVVKTVSGISTPCTGRLFSKNWSFNTDSYANPFYGSFYIYGTDSSVTKVNLNGIKPYKFRVSCNSFGTSQTGNSTNDRRSKIGFAVPPELKLFLSDPDIVTYPNGSLTFLNSPVTLSRCVKDSVCINVDLTKKADVTIIIDRNNNNKYDPGTADRKLFFPQVNAGQNCLYWDAKDGFGAYIPVTNLVSVMVSVESGEVDLPLFDVENHETGFSMSVIRPGSALFVDSIFYDDVLVGGLTNLGGCAFPCHTWTSSPANTDQNSIGNNNTMNSWWFAHKLSSKTNLPMPDYLITNVGSDFAACTNGSNLDSIQLTGSIAYTQSAYTGSKQWTTTGTGFFVPNDSVFNPKYVPSAADISSGNVSLYLAPRNGCSFAKDTLLLTVKKNPVLASSVVHVKCFGGATGSINISVSGSTAPYSYLWSNGNTSQNLTSVVAGTYTVTVTSANGCKATTSATLTQPSAALAMTTSAVAVKCFGGSTGSISTTVSGGTLPYTYAWSNGSTSANITGIPAGNYTVTVTDANNCSATTASINVSQPSATLAVSGSASSVSCFGNSTGTITTTVSGGTAPYSYAWSNGATTANIAGVASGNYSVTVTDANLCTIASSTINVSQPSTALSAGTGTITSVSCFGASNGAVNLTVSGGTSPYTYVWSNGATTQNLSNVAAGTYTVTVTDAKSCTTVVSGISVTQPAGALSNTVTSTSTVSCFGANNGAIDLSVSGGTTPYTYAWSNGATTQDLTNIPAGTYSVTVTDARGCTAVTAGIAVTQPTAALSSSVSSSNNVSCFGGTNGAINLAVTGGTAPYTYVWSNAATSQNLTGIGAGTYAVTVTDARGCTAQNNAITITQPAVALAASIISSSNVLCFGGNSGAINLTVAGGTSPYSFVWSNGTTTEDLAGIVAGTYSVTVTDAKGCTVSVTGVTISQPSAALSTSATHTNVNCRNEATASINLTVAGGTAPYAYNWSSGATTEDLNNMAAGNYTVTVTDFNGCTATSATITITQPAAVLAGSVVTTANVACNSGANGALDLTVTGGTSPYSYSWSNGAATQDIGGLYSGNYVVTVTDANGCTTEATGIVSQPAGSLNSSIAVTQNVSCFGGTNGAIDLTVSGGTTPYTYQWSNGATTQDVSGLSSGSYTVTVHDANNCINISTVVVDQPVAALSSSATSVSAVLCYGGNSGAIDVTVSGGTAPYSYSWNSGATSQDLNNIAAGSYSVTVTDAKGCTTQTNGISVTQPSGALSATVSTSTNVSCFGGGNGAINLTVSGGTSPYTYAWSNGANTQNISGLSAGSYGVTVTDANNCVKTLSALSITQPGIALNATPGSTTNVSCFGGGNGVINLTVIGGTTPYSYVWSNGATTQNITALTAGNYVATITDAQGCIFQTSAISISQPAAALSVNTSATGNVNCFGGSNGTITIAVTGGTTPYSYAWSNGATTQNLAGLVAGSYSVTITDAKGCTTPSGAISITQPSAALASSATATNVNCFGDASGAINLTLTGGTTPYTYAWSNGATTQNITNLIAGTYSVTVTDAKGCTTTSASLSVTQPTATLASSATATLINCFGNSTGAVTLTVTGGTAPYAYVWSNGATTQNLTSIAAGMYTVTVTDAKGCINTSSSINVTQPSAALTSSTSATQVNCYGNATGSITLTVSGGTTPYSYTWSNGAVTQNLSGLVAGTYSVTVTDAKGCVSAPSSISITQPSAALATSVAATQVNCFNDATGALNLTVTGGTSPYNYLWNNGATSEDLSNLSAGTYSVTVTDAKGCVSSQASITITQPSAALASSATATAVKCFGNATGAVNLTVTGGTAPYNFAWSNGAVTQNLTTIVAGVYAVTITDAKGCVSTAASIQVTQPTGVLSSSVASVQDVNCFGNATGAINLNVNGGTTPYAFVWSTGATSQNLTGVAAGIYTVTVTDVNLCSSTNASITIAQPSAAISGTVVSTQNVSCNSGANGALDLTVAGGTAPYTYTWSNGETTQDISGLFSGTYIVTVTDALGCLFTVSGTVSQPANALGAAISSLQEVLCYGGANASITLSVTGGTTPYSYAWSNGSTTPNISGLAAGTYTATVTDANGCISSVSKQITQPSLALGAVATVSQNVSCYGLSNGSISLVVTGGTLPYSFAWSNGATTQNITALSAGSYHVSVTDANGCITQVNAITVSQPSAPLTSSASITNAGCYGELTGGINLTVTGGTSPYSYTWSNGATTQNLTNVAYGTYSVTVTDALSCSVAQTAIQIGQPSASITASASSTTNVSCFGGTNGVINLAVAGGTAPYTYLWSNGATSQNITGVGSGSYSVTVTDAHNCVLNIGSLVITQPAATLTTSLTTGQNVACNGGGNGSINLSVAGGTAPYTYNWSNGATTQDLSGLYAGTYGVSVTDANGCTASATGTVSQPSGALSTSISSSQNVLCFGGNNGSANVTASGGTTPYTYAWSNGSTTQNIANLSSGNYSVTVTDANGCLSQSSVVISQPTATLSATVTSVQNVLCYNLTTASIDVTVTGGTAPFTYQWSNGATTQDLSNIGAGTYSVTITDANACSYNLNGVIISQPAEALTVNNSVANVNCFGGNTGGIDVTVTGGTSPYGYVWNNGAVTQDLTGVASGSYTVTVTDANGCTSGNASVQITQPSAALATYASPTAVSCFGNMTGAINLTLTGGTTPYSYNWSNGATTQNLTNIAAGTYSVTVTDAQGCVSAQTAINVTQPTAALAMSDSVINAGCFGNSTGAIDVTVTGGTLPYFYIWSNGSTTQDLTSVSAGTYTLTITDANGCTSGMASMQVEQPSAELYSTVASSQNVNCFGDATGSISVTAAGGTSPYIFDWSSGETTSTITNLTAGSYSVTITDANGCVTSINAIAINQPGEALASSVNTTQNVNCFAQSTGAINLNVSGGTIPYAYNWSNGATTQNISGLAAGTYSVTINDANGCTTAVSGVSISQPNASLNAIAASTNNTSCTGGGNGAVDITVSGGTTPYSFNWNNGATTEDISGLLAGNYVVTITDANGCTASVSDSVNQPPTSLYSNIQSTQNINCFGNATGSIDVTVSGGVTPYSFNWSNGATTEDISNLVSGTYTVTITDGNGCDNTRTAILTQPLEALQATVSASIQILCFADSTGSIDLTVTGGTLPYTYAWSTGASTEDISGLASGTYNVTITDINGCTTNTNTTLTQPGASLTSSITSTQNVSCNAGANGAINLDIQGGTAPYSVVWSNGSTDQNPTGLIAGTYTASITDANGCTGTQSATISQPAATVSATIASQQNINCFGNATGAVDITITGGTSPYTFNWSNGATTEDITGISSGIYAVTITDAQGCTVDLNATLSQPSAALNANAAATQNVLCFGGNTAIVDLTVNGGTMPYVFNWSNGATTEDLSNLALGSYTVTITDANGCSASASATVTQPSGALNATYVQTSSVLCYGGSDGALDATVIGGTAPYTYSWSNGITTEDISSVSAGNYTLIVTDANGCNFTMNAVVTQPNGPLSPSIASLVPVGCFADSTGSLDLTVNGGTPPYLYYWNTGANTQDLTNIPGGSYYVTVLDSNGCAAQQWAYIQTPEGALLAYPSITHLNCFSLTSGSLILNTTGGTAPYSFNWNTGATTEDLINITAGQYTVTITDSAGCSTDTTLTVNGPTALLDIQGAAKNVHCFNGQTGEISVVATGGIPPYTYAWTNGASTPNLINLTAGNYKVIVSDTYGCSQDSLFLITQPDSGIADVVAVTEVTCFGQNNASIQVTASGGTAPYSYQWSNGVTIPSLNNLAPGNYTLTIYDAAGCDKAEVIEIQQPVAAMQVSGSATDANCLSGIGGTASIQVLGGNSPYAYAWSNGSSDANLQNVQQGTYQLTVTDAHGCIANYEQTINDLSVFSMSADGPTEFCTGGVVTLTALSVPGGSYQWYQDGNVLTGATHSTFTTPATGTYTVTVSANCGMYTSNPINVVANALGNYSVSPNVIICPAQGEKADLAAYGGSWYSWNPGYGLTDSTSANPVASPEVTTKYTVTISSNEGCSATAEILVTVVCDSMFVPTGFSPDGDGVNDTYVIDGLGHYPGNNLFIYNRWGNLVFKKKDYDNSFDGTSNVSGVYLGKQLPNGTYFFILDLNDGKKPQQGYITLKR